jgi:hypothetical protein
MVILCLLILLGADPPQAGSGENVPQALTKGKYPWYDPGRDAIKPVALPSDFDLSRQRWLDFRMPGLSIPVGQILAILVLVALLVALFVMLAWYWRFPELQGPQLAKHRRGSGSAARVGTLPPGFDIDLTDPWGEAVRRRERGDYAGAIICLFVHQLLVLDQLGLARPTPGRTGRQIVRSVADSWVRARVEPTLGLFERVYYGHRVPTAQAFEAAWSDALALERRVAEGAFA